MTTIRLPDELVEAIDRLRGLVPREAWVRNELQKVVATLTSKKPS